MIAGQRERPACPGAGYRKTGVCEFTVWAPLLESVSVKITRPETRILPMRAVDRGYWRTTAVDIHPGALYFYILNNQIERPDPASRSQPQGVHGPSQVIDPHEFVWMDSGWKGIPLERFIIYEIHVGAFTVEGTFEAAISRLDYLKDLGITALEIMPVAQFPGARNWGYDGVYPFAPQNSYGGPDGLKKLVNACHGKGLAVILDVVYNHLGPEGNYLNDFGPYFTGKYRTPWGEAINYDGPYSDDVRTFFIQNALYWITEYHFDALRLDAIDTIYDYGAHHFLAELADAVHTRAAELGRAIFIIAESDLNDVKVIKSQALGGYGLDGQWCDDFHHSLHSLITGERNGYYQDFGDIAHLEKAFSEGFVYSGCYSQFRKRKHGSSSKDCSPSRFVVCTQNHDQIGNRMLGDRLSTLVSFERLKLAAGCVALSPFIPLLFMGEEYGETAPFQYFVSHIDEPLIAAVRKGRAEEFAHFAWQGEVPDPQDESTFLRSKINQELRRSGRHKILFQYYGRLFHLRKSIAALSCPKRKSIVVSASDRNRTLKILRRAESGQAFVLMSFHDGPVSIQVELPKGIWIKQLDSSAREWGGKSELSEAGTVSPDGTAALRVNPYSLVLYTAGERL